MEKNNRSLEKIADVGRGVIMAATLYGVLRTSPAVIGIAIVGAIGLDQLDNRIYCRRSIAESNYKDIS